MNEQEKQLWFDVFHQAYNTIIPGDLDCNNKIRIGVDKAAKEANEAVERYREAKNSFDRNK